MRRGGHRTVAGDRRGEARLIAGLFSALHMLALGIGLGSAFLRRRALRSRTFDKETDFYVHNGLFWVKMGLLAVLLALETRPMVTFVRWRLAVSRGGVPDVARVALLARINDLEVALVVLMVFVAAMMARGLWLLT